MLPARTSQEVPEMMRIDREGTFARLAGFFYPQRRGMPERDTQDVPMHYF